MLMDVLVALSEYILIAGIISLILWVLQVIALWKIFTKAGQSGWKAIIPLYNVFIMFKISWSTMWFWISLIVFVLASALLSFATVTICVVLGGLLMLFYNIVMLIMLFKFVRSFNWGVGMFILTIIVPVIMLFVLAFGKAEYIGPDPIS